MSHLKKLPQRLVRFKLREIALAEYCGAIIHPEDDSSPSSNGLIVAEIKLYLDIEDHDLITQAVGELVKVGFTARFKFMDQTTIVTLEERLVEKVRNPVGYLRSRVQKIEELLDT
jgi:hypothetical protein